MLILFIIVARGACSTRRFVYIVLLRMHYSWWSIHLLVWSTICSALDPIDLNGADVFGELGSGINQIPQQAATLSSSVAPSSPPATFTLPLCSSSEYLTSDGTSLICRPFPPCNCRYDCNADPPLPPRGCQALAPPMKGALVCLRSVDIMYCSVYCDYLFEFSSSPLNPYYCGRLSNYKWTSSITGLSVPDLPRCTGVRYRNTLLFPLENYLPTPCYSLPNTTTLAILSSFHSSLVAKKCTNCDLQNVFLDCPTVDGNVLFYKDIH